MFIEACWIVSKEFEHCFECLLERDPKIDRSASPKRKKRRFPLASKKTSKSVPMHQKLRENSSSPISILLNPKVPSNDFGKRVLCFGYLRSTCETFLSNEFSISNAPEIMIIFKNGDDGMKVLVRPPS